MKSDFYFKQKKIKEKASAEHMRQAKYPPANWRDHKPV